MITQNVTLSNAQESKYKKEGLNGVVAFTVIG